MSEPDDSFSKLLGRQPTGDERQNLYRVRDALGLRDNDALWLVLVALQHYQTQYERFPQEIARASKDALTEVRTTADAAMKAAAAAAKADLAKAVASSAMDVARRVAGRQWLQWMSASLVLAFLAFGLFGWWMHTDGERAGYRAGYGAGYTEARDEKAAAAWANTPEGRMAYRLAQTGSLPSLLRCDQPGWAIEKGACYPRPAPNGSTWGWRLP